MTDLLRRVSRMMELIRSTKTASLSAAIVSLCVLLSTVGALGGPLQGAASGVSDFRTLAHSDLLSLLDCATRFDQVLAVKPESYGGDTFRGRYLYPVKPDGRANMLNSLSPANWVVLVLYNSDERSAALFEVGFDGPTSKRTYVLLDGANLEKQRERWAVRDILNGAASTWPEIAGHAERLRVEPLVTVPRQSVRRTGAACEFPAPGQTFVAVSITGDQSNWKFNDGVSKGIPFQSRSGPFHNSDLKSVPSRQVWMNMYGAK